jgi:hypothetical protein
MAELTAELAAAMGVLSDPQVSPEGRPAVQAPAQMGREDEHPASAPTR